MLRFADVGSDPFDINNNDPERESAYSQEWHRAAHSRGRKCLQPSLEGKPKAESVADHKGSSFSQQRGWEAVGR